MSATLRLGPPAAAICLLSARNVGQVSSEPLIQDEHSNIWHINSSQRFSTGLFQRGSTFLLSAIVIGSPCSGLVKSAVLSIDCPDTSNSTTNPHTFTQKTQVIERKAIRCPGRSAIPTVALTELHTKRIPNLLFHRSRFRVFFKQRG